jgi:hypothetical protein
MNWWFDRQLRWDRMLERGDSATLESFRPEAVEVRVQAFLKTKIPTGGDHPHGGKNSIDYDQGNTSAG